MREDPAKAMRESVSIRPSQNAGYFTIKMAQSSVRATMQMESMMAAAAFIEKTLSIELPHDHTIMRSLRDGIVLCQLINKLKPGAVPRISARPLPFLQMENISNFLTAAKEYGVKDSDLFLTVDLFEAREPNQVFITILQLARLAGDTDIANRTPKRSNKPGIDYIDCTPSSQSPQPNVTSDSTSSAATGTNVPPLPSQPQLQPHVNTDPHEPQKTTTPPFQAPNVSMLRNQASHSSIPSAQQPHTVPMTRPATPAQKLAQQQHHSSQSVDSTHSAPESTIDRHVKDTESIRRPSTPQHSKSKEISTPVIVMGYQLGNSIGRGQFGTVYKALHQETGQVMAVKRIPLQDRNKKEIDDLMNEVELLKSLSHPNIVHYHGFIRDEEYLNIVLEYVENGSLASLLKTFGTMPEKLCANYMVQVLEGLNYLHEKDVVHCDLKAANILNTKDGTVKLSDFGVSMQLNVLDQNTKAVVGTPYWMAPEIIDLTGACTKSDIWSLGCTVLEVVTGKAPYLDLNPLTAMFRIVEDDMPLLPDTLSETLLDFLTKCFVKKTSERASARQLMSHPWISSSQRATSSRAGSISSSHMNDKDEWNKLHIPTAIDENSPVNNTSLPSASLSRSRSNTTGIAAMSKSPPISHLTRSKSMESKLRQVVNMNDDASEPNATPIPPVPPLQIPSESQNVTSPLSPSQTSLHGKAEIPERQTSLTLLTDTSPRGTVTSPQTDTTQIRPLSAPVNHKPTRERPPTARTTASEKKKRRCSIM